MPNDKRYKVEGYWDCQYCGRTQIKGRFKSCPGCGHGRDASVRFYTIDVDQAHAIDQEEFLRETDEADRNSRSDSAHYSKAHEADGSTPSLFDRKEGQGTGTEADATDTSDWYCDFCDSYNPAAANFCRNCGAPREQSTGKTYEQTMGKVARTYDANGNLVSERDLSTRKPKESVKPTVEASSSKGGFPTILVVLAVVAAIVGLGILLFGPKTKDIKIQSFDWEQTIEIEELQTVQESDWTMPSDARLVRKSQEIRSYNHVVDHYETQQVQVPEQVIDHYETYTTQVDNGDGTFDVEEHEEPVYKTEYRTETQQVPIYVDIPIYDTKYYYETEKYVHTRDVTTSGDDHAPYWGETNLSKATGEHGTGEEREGARHGTYGVTDSDGKHYTADEDFWQTLEVGEKLKVVVDSSGHITPKK